MSSKFEELKLISPLTEQKLDFTCRHTLINTRQCMFAAALKAVQNVVNPLIIIGHFPEVAQCCTPVIYHVIIRPISKNKQKA
jgi:phosphohistidine phosphatase SixA